MEQQNFELNKQAFGSFLAQLRREKGWTQKNLAERLYVSDKAVSKWERGLSVPDVSLLLPLAELLGISVTELLEGRRLEEQQLPANEVEALVKKALTISKEPVEVRRGRVKKYLPVYLVCNVLGAVEALADHFAVGTDLDGRHRADHAAAVCGRNMDRETGRRGARLGDLGAISWKHGSVHHCSGKKV